MAKSYQTVAEEVLAILAQATEPMRLPAVFAAATLPESSTPVASALNVLLKQGRVERTGEAFKFEYVISDAGRAFLDKPKRDPDIQLGRHENEASNPPSRKATRAKKAGRQPRSLTTRPMPASQRQQDSVQQAIEQFAATTEATVIPRDANESRTRLAALVIAYWPVSLDQMPPTLAEALDASLGALRAGA